MLHFVQHDKGERVCDHLLIALEIGYSPDRPGVWLYFPLIPIGPNRDPNSDS